MSFDNHIRSRLAELEGAGLLRQPRTVEGPQGPSLHMAGRDVVGLCSNNYLGLASHPDLVEAAHNASREYGLGSGASRHISGSMTVHLTAQSRLARFVAQPASLLFSTGYAANVGAIPALVGASDIIFSDALNHASLIDGCRLSRASVHVYPHLDLDALRDQLAAKRAQHGAALVLTESVFSMDGDLAPLQQLRALCDEFDAALLVDEAHALGVLGPQGRGLCMREDVRADVIIGTLGKAFGSSGAFVAGAQDTVRLVENRARSYVFSTAPPPALAATALAATDLVEDGDALRVQLMNHVRYLRSKLGALGYRVLDGEAQIIPVIIGDPAETMELSAALLENGVFVHGIRPPTVPTGTSRLRITPMATHSAEQIETAVNALAKLKP